MVTLIDLGKIFFLSHLGYNCYYMVSLILTWCIRQSPFTNFRCGTFHGRDDILYRCFKNHQDKFNEYININM